MFQQLVFNSTPVSIYELPTPLVIGSEHYRFHINHQIFGQNRAATQRLYDATQWLRQISSLGNSVADIVHRELMGGHLILLADARPSLAWHNSSEQVFGIWGKLRAIAGHNNGLKISGKIVNDCFIKVAVDPSLSSAAILDFYSHEAAHHLTYVSSGRLSSDPAYHSLLLKNQIIDGLNRDMHAFTGRVKELKMDAALIKVAEDILFERPFSYLTPSRSSLSELRSEIIAYHLQMEMIKPGSTKIFSPEVSRYLHECLFSQSVSADCFFSANRIHRYIKYQGNGANLAHAVPTLSDVVNPVRAALPYDFKKTSDAIHALSRDPHFRANKNLFFNDLRQYKVNEGALDNVLAQNDRVIREFQLVPQEPALAKSRLARFVTVLPKLLAVLHLGANFYEEYHKDGRPGEWVNHALLNNFIDHLVYAPLIHARPELMLCIASDVMHHIAKDNQAHCHDQLLAYQHKINPTSHDKAMEQIWERRYIDAGIGIGMTYLAHKVSEPIHSAAANIKNWAQSELAPQRKAWSQFFVEQRNILPNNPERQEFLNELEGAIRSPVADLVHLGIGAVRTLINKAYTISAQVNQEINVLRQRVPLTDEREAHLLDLHIAQQPFRVAYHLITDLFTAPLPVPVPAADIALVNGAFVGADRRQAPNNPPVRVMPTSSSPRNPDRGAAGANNQRATPIQPNNNAAASTLKRLPDFNPALAKNRVNLLNPAPVQPNGLATQPTPTPVAPQPIDPLRPEHPEKPTKVNPFEIQNMQFGVRINDQLAVVAEFQADFKGGSSGGFAIEIGKKGFVIMFSSKLAMTEETWEALASYMAGYWSVAVPVIVLCGAGIYYLTMQQRKEMKAARHMERHLVATQQDMDKYFSKSFNKLINDIFDLKFNKQDRDKKMNKVKRDLSEGIEELVHRSAYAYKHGGYGAHLYHALHANQTRQLLTDVNLNERHGKELRREYRRAVKKCSNTELDTLIKDYKNQLNPANKKAFTRKEAAMLSAMRDTIVKKCIDDKKFDILVQNPWLLEENAIQYYELPQIDLPEVELEKHDLKSKGEFKKKCHTRDDVKEKMEQLHEAYLNFKTAVEDKKDHKTILNLADAFLKLYSQYEKEFQNVKTKAKDDKKKLISVFDFYKVFFEQMFNAVDSIKKDIENGGQNAHLFKLTFAANINLKHIDIFLKVLNEFKDKTAQDIIDRAKSVINDKRKLSAEESAEISTLYEMLMCKITQLAIDEKWDEALGYLNDAGAICKVKDQDGKAIGDKAKIADIRGAIQFAQENAHQDLTFWLDQLRAEVAKIKPVTEGSDQQEYSIDHQLILNTLYKRASARIERAFYYQAAELLKQMQQIDASLKHDDRIKNLHFAHVGQVLDPLAKALQQGVETFVDGMDPSLARRMLKGCLVAAHGVQLFAPNALALSAQGFYGYFRQDLVAFNKAMADLGGKIVLDFKSPWTYGGAMLYANLMTAAINTIPFEKMAPMKWREHIEHARYTVASFGYEGIKLAHLAHAAWELKKYGVDHAYAPLHVGGIMTTATEYAFAAYSAFKKLKGEAPENPNFYRSQHAINSVINTAASARHLFILQGLGTAAVCAITSVQAGVSTYQLFSRSGKQTAAAKALFASIQNIMFNSKKMGDMPPASTPSQALARKVRTSTNNIEQVLRNYFGGLRFNPRQLREANEACAFHLGQRARASYSSRQYTEVMTLSQKYDAGSNGSITLINEQYQIPSYMVWDVIRLRLISLLEANGNLHSFPKEFEDYATSIYHGASKELTYKFDKQFQVKTELNKIVAAALGRFQIKAAVSTDNGESKRYLNLILSTYSYCPKWYEHLTPSFIFECAEIAYHSQDMEDCKTFLSRLNLPGFLSTYTKNLSVLDMLMFGELAANHFTSQLINAVNTGKFTDGDLTTLVFKLLEQKKYQQVLDLPVTKSFPSKFLARAKATYWLNNHSKIADVISILMQETTRDFDWWNFLNGVMLDLRQSLYFIKNIGKNNDAFIKLNCLIYAACKQLELLNTNIQLNQDIANILASAKENLTHYIKQTHPPAAQMQPLSDLQIKQHLTHMLQFSERLLRGGELESEIQAIIANFAYSEANGTTQSYLPFPLISRSKSVLSAFDDKNSKCIEKLKAHLQNDQWTASLNNRAAPIKTITALVFDYYELATHQRLRREQACFRQDCASIIHHLETFINSDPSIKRAQGGDALLSALSLLYGKSVCLYEVNQDEKLTTAYQQQLTSSSDMVRLIYTELPASSSHAAASIYARLIPIRVQHNAARLVVETSPLISTPHELVVKQQRDQPNRAAINWFFGNEADDYYVIGERVLVSSPEYAIDAFRHAIGINPKHAPALYQLYLLFKSRNNGAEAQNYLSRALSEDYYPAKNAWLLNQTVGSAAEWVRKADVYFHGSTNPVVAQDFKLAYAAYKQAIKLKPTRATADDLKVHSKALYGMVCLMDARHVFDLALDQFTHEPSPQTAYTHAFNTRLIGYINEGAQLGHERLKLRKLSIDNPETTSAEQWVILGHQYSNVRGSNHDPFLAKTCYEFAERKGSLDGCSYHLLHLHRSHTGAALTANEWYRLGQHYQEGSNNLVQNYLRARACYVLASTGAPNSAHADALCAHALLRESIDNNLPEALALYKSAIDAGSRTARVNYIKLKWQATNLFPSEVMSANASYKDWFILAEELFNLTNNYPCIRDAAIYCYGIVKSTPHDYTAEALYKLGLLYEAKQQCVEAAKSFQQACEKQHALARVRLNLLKQNPAVDSESLNNIGVFFHVGTEVKPNYQEAMSWYQLAMAKSNRFAYHNAALLYKEGLIDGTKNYVEAMRHHRLSLKNNYNDADAIRLFEDSVASQTTPDVQNQIGIMLCNEENLRHYSESLKWFKSAAQKNCGAALRNVGFFHEKGYGFANNEIDYVQSYIHYQKALENGYSSTEDINRLDNTVTVSGANWNSIGVAFHNGTDIKRNYEQAEVMYRRAIKKDCAHAYNNMGVIYEDHHHFYSSAKYYYRLAVRYGFTDAQKHVDRIEGILKRQDELDKKGVGGVLRKIGQFAEKVIIELNHVPQDVISHLKS